MKRYFLLCLFLFGLVYVKGQDGTLDSTFAGKGWTILNFFDKGNYSDEYAIKLLVQDNNYVVVFELEYFTVVARYFPDGRLDTTFGDKGFSSLINLDPKNAALQGDGKILVAGSYGYYDSISHEDFSLIRFNANGTVDSSFGTDGMARVKINNEAFATAVAVQNDGKIVAAGESYNDTSYYDFAVVRFNENGSLDSTFDGDGIQTTAFYSSTYDEVKAIAIQSDNRILVEGNIYFVGTGERDFGFARYNTDGSLDSSFGINGLVSTNVSSNDLPADVLVEADGKILAGGSGYGSSMYDYDFLLLRYDSTGALDTSFGNGGIVITDFEGGYDFGYSLGLQEDGKIILGGNAYIYDSINFKTVLDFAFARYLDNGNLDSTFGGDGKASISFGVSSNNSLLAILPDKKVVALGTYYVPDNVSLAMVRIDSTGSPDSSFADTGKTILYYPTLPPAYFQSTAVQNDGKILVGGRSILPQAGHEGFALARYNSNGTLDPGFGNGGTVTTDFEYSSYGTSLAVQSDGKILLAGSVEDSNNYDNFALARYNSDGTLDSSFGIQGKVITNFEGYNAFINDLETLNDGKIVVVGGLESIGSYSYDVGLARYNQDGTLDTSGFGISGKVITDLGQDENLYHIAIQKDGKIVGTGDSRLYNSSDFMVIRYNTNGSLDSSFSGDGVVYTDLGGDDIAYDIKIASYGILVCGNRFDSSNNADFALACYDSTGELNNNFGTAGVSFTNFGLIDIGLSLALQTDGKFIVTGVTEPSNAYDFNLALARYDSTGNLDPGFGTAGKTITDLSNPSYVLSSVWYGGKLYTAGAFLQIFSESGLLVSYNASAEIAGPPIISINDVTAYENAGTANLTVSLNKSSHPALTINYQTRDGSAVSKGKSPDYKSAKGTVTIPDGSTSAQISITIKTDKVNEGPENFFVDLSLSRRMSDKAIIGDTTGVVTILNVSGLLDELTEANKPQVQVVSTNTLFSAKALPNPSTRYFTLKLESKNDVPISINVVDASGRLVERLKNISPNSSLQLGSNYHTGIYYAHVIQGNEKLTLKLIKE